MAVYSYDVPGPNQEHFRSVNDTVGAVSDVVNDVKQQVASSIQELQTQQSRNVGTYPEAFRNAVAVNTRAAREAANQVASQIGASIQGEMSKAGSFAAIASTPTPIASTPPPLPYKLCDPVLPKGKWCWTLRIVAYTESGNCWGTTPAFGASGGIFGLYPTEQDAITRFFQPDMAGMLQNLHYRVGAEWKQKDPFTGEQIIGHYLVPDGVNDTCGTGPQSPITPVIQPIKPPEQINPPPPPICTPPLPPPISSPCPPPIINLTCPQCNAPLPSPPTPCPACPACNCSLGQVNIINKQTQTQWQNAISSVIGTCDLPPETINILNDIVNNINLENKIAIDISIPRVERKPKKRKKPIHPACPEKAEILADGSWRIEVYLENFPSLRAAICDALNDIDQSWVEELERDPDLPTDFDRIYRDIFDQQLGPLPTVPREIPPHLDEFIRG